ncbi:methyltransferase domain-containing protein [Acidobacteria bacterium ACD]|nr:MAG: methyltransferase domain-containing protein [Acidobacteriota bacterium]MCE7957854.1 methyltransferase domain-containing protein [Acidobacteria bacterium ACB2]MDL1949158.1 methyltransferase domain-containing protein [Acidobacteria bacterium ACD]
MSRNRLAETYDELPYGSFAFQQTHPGRLAAVGRLLGMTPPPVATCRVLEVGCADGGNLLPMAATIPGGRFLGVELSARQARHGQRKIASAGLTNVEIVHADLLDVAASLGEFDYVIAYGLFSWVPEAVREALLGVLGRCLSPQGIAYVNYNAWPGSSARNVLRGVLRWHLRDGGPLEGQVEKARAFHALLLESARDRTENYQRLLRAEKEWSDKLSPSSYYHDLLEVENVPFWFHEVAAMAARHGLQYLGEVDLAAMPTAAFHPAMDRLIRSLGGTRVEREQYADVLRNRRFRETLLCRAGVEVREELEPSAVEEMFFASLARASEGTPDLSPGVEARFTSRTGRSLSTDDPVMKAALVELATVWPRALSLDELLPRALGRLGEAAEPPGPARERLLGYLLSAHVAEIVEGLLFRVDVSPEATARPRALASARVEAEESRFVGNAWHIAVEMGDMERAVLTLLDGTRDRPALAVAVAERAVREGMLKDAEGRVVTDPRKVREVVEANLEGALGRIAESALLVP